MVTQSVSILSLLRVLCCGSFLGMGTCLLPRLPKGKADDFACEGVANSNVGEGATMSNVLVCGSASRMTRKE